MDDVLWQLDEVTLRGDVAPRLRPMSVTIGRGVTAVLGPSGSGKTSLLNLLVGFESPDGGRLAGPASTDGHTLPLYWVPQSGGLWPHLCAREHLLRVRPRGSRDGEDDIDALLDAFDLRDRADAYPDELSEGERSRLSVARALSADAAVLVMDEPLAHVGAVQAGSYWERIARHVSERGASLIFTTHLPRTVLREAEHVVCLREGKLLYAGEVSTLYRSPETPELAECLGEANWFDADAASRWLGRTGAGTLCLRPEHVSVEKASASDLMVTRSRFMGDVAEVTLEHAPSGERRRIFHRPSSERLAPGDRVILRLLLVLLAVLVVGCGRGETSLEVAEVHHWSMPPDGVKIPAPRGVDVTASGEAVVIDTSGRMLVLDREGKHVRAWRMPETDVGTPEDVCVLADGRIAVADTHYHQVVFFDATGRELKRLGTHGRGPGEFIYPVGLTEDDAGHLYVCEYGGNDRVQKFTRDGTFVAAFGTFGTGPDAFQRPSGMAWHEGRLYVADAINNRIQVFQDDGAFVGTLGEDAGPPSLHYPYDVAMGPDGALYVAEYGAGRVTKLALDGSVLGRFGSSGTGPRELRTPWGVAADASRVLVADTGNRRIVELRLPGNTACRVRAGERSR